MTLRGVWFTLAALCLAAPAPASACDAVEGQEEVLLKKANDLASRDQREEARAVWIQILRCTPAPNLRTRVQLAWGEAVVRWCQSECDDATRREGLSALDEVIKLAATEGVRAKAQRLRGQLAPVSDPWSWRLIGAGAVALIGGGVATATYIDNRAAIREGFDTSTNQDQKDLSLAGMIVGYSAGAGLIAWGIFRGIREDSVSWQAGPGYLGLAGRW